jgi:Heparinase II/III-like protein/Heparinase II/III N-terminus
MRRLAARLARMDAAELAWRGTTAARTAFDRLRSHAAAPRWQRQDLLPALARIPELEAARAALSGARWDAAQRELARYFINAPQRFVISPSARVPLRDRIRAGFRHSASHAAERADRVVAGEYDLLAYDGLKYEGDRGLPDWGFDPVHHRRPPEAFWSTVAYLSPECGDHKIIWELNRHQHWLVLGRAFWLTGDARYRDRFLAELVSWLDANPPLIGINWASMLELAFRAISWVWALNFFVDGRNDETVEHITLNAETAEAAEKNSQDFSVCSASSASSVRRTAEPPWIVDMLVALDRQLTQVERNLSHYFSPNTHLLGEALALYVAGRALPELVASAHRELTGRTILLAEIGRQIEDDGGHCERSTHYHRYALDFYVLALVVARRTGDPAASAFEEAVARLGSAARLLADDRGRMPHIGDDDGGSLLPIAGRARDDLRDSLAIAAALVQRPGLRVGPVPEEAFWMLGADPRIPDPERPLHDPESPAPLRSAALPRTGYYVSRSRAGDHLVIDGGPHGYQNAGHAHADALSLTFSPRGVPLLIDPGTGSYTFDLAVRDRLRSTALHNTLTIDGRPQSLPSGPFHWSHIANGRVHTWRTNEGFDYFDGAHDGYRPLEHRRRVLALHGDLLIVADFVNGDGPRAAAVHWHLDPQWTVEAHGRRASITRPGGRVGLVVPQGQLEHFVADADTGLGWYSPVYGRVDRTTSVRVSHSGTAPFWMVSVFDLDPDNPVADVDWVPVWSEAGVLAHATAIRISRAASVDHVLFAEPTADDAAAGQTAAAPGGVLPATAADAPIKGARRWRVGEVETDARMLFYRSTSHRPLTQLALVDGSLARVGGRHGFDITLPRVAADFFTDATEGSESGQRLATND